MKIYIDKYNINKLSKKMPLLQPYYANSKANVFIYSAEGIFKIDENTILKLNILSDKVDKSQMDGFIFIVDESKIVYENYTHIPNEHICNNVTRHMYKTNRMSKVQFVIEGFYKDTVEGIQRNFVPTDFYFETNVEDKIYNPIIKDDLNVFLSILN